MIGNNQRLQIKDFLWFLVLVGLFGVSWYGANYYKETIGVFIGQGGVLSVGLYFLVTVVGIVVAPFSAFPLLPMAVATWGSFWSASDSKIY